LDYSGDYGWQCSGKGRVDGIAGDVDLDYCYKDYPSVIKGCGFNGYGKVAAEKTVDEHAREVIAGKWSNGYERKQRLTAAGYDYSVVQTRVNEILK
jgi:GH25 family lysozyme M1 (1,4-beta-N-acetylmuramidase)